MASKALPGRALLASSWLLICSPLDAVRVLLLRVSTTGQPPSSLAKASINHPSYFKKNFSYLFERQSDTERGIDRQPAQKAKVAWTGPSRSQGTGPSSGSPAGASDSSRKRDGTPAGHRQHTLGAPRRTLHITLRSERRPSGTPWPDQTPGTAPRARLWRLHHRHSEEPARGQTRKPRAAKPVSTPRRPEAQEGAPSTPPSAGARAGHSSSARSRTDP